MSSTSNVQDLLVNVFRPTYRWQDGTGFVPALVLSNVTEIITSKVKTDALIVSDSNVNTYIGSNAGNLASNTQSNVAIGYSAMASARTSSNNVALGIFSLDGLSNANSNVAIGARTDITGTGDRNILIGPNTTMGDGSYNILIGSGIAAGNANYRFQLGTLLYGDLCMGYLGVNNSTPSNAFDVCGISYFRDKVGIQKLPDYTLDVNGSVNITERLLVGPGTSVNPIYSFKDIASGLYQAADASYGTGAVGVSVNGQTRVVIASNKTYIYGNLDVCGALSAVSGGGGGGGTVASNGTASIPSFTFSNDLSTGLHLVNNSSLGFDTSGQLRMCLSGGFLGIGTEVPRVALDVSGDISANVYNGPGGTQSAPHYTFSADRTTGLFFPGANMIGFTAGGTERVRISNGNVGIGTSSPANALDVAGTLRVAGGAGDILLTNGTISIGGTQVVSSTGVLANSGTTSNSIGGVVLSNSNAIIGGFLRNALTPTTYDISGGNISNSGTTTSTNAIVSGYLRNALTPTTYDISGGNISNSGVHTTGGLVGTYLRNALTPTTYDISGGNISNLLTTASSNFRAFPGTASTPTYSFATDPSSGLHLIGTSRLAFDTGGIQRMCISGSLVGIGPATTTPRSQLHVFDACLTNYIMMETSGLATSMGLRFLGYSNGAGGGRFETFRMEVSGTSTGQNDLVWSTPWYPDQMVSGGDPITFQNEKMRLRWDGSLGLGTNAPQATLDVSGSFRAGTATGGTLNVYDGWMGWTTVDTTASVYFYGDLAKTNATAHFVGPGEVMASHYIRGANLGVGTTTPATTLEVAGTTTTSNAIVSGYLRNALTPTTYDISGGNISNSGTTTSTNAILSGYVRNALTPSQFDISGGNISNSGVHTTTGLVGTYLRNALTPTTYDISGGNISNSLTTRSSNFRGSNGTVAIPTYSFTTDPSTGLHLGSGGSYLAFDTSGVQRMCISGNLVGIGTSTPGALLDISSNGSLGFRVGNANTALFDVCSGGNYANVSTNGYFTIYKAGTVAKGSANIMVQLTPEANSPYYFLSNNVGIGTTTPLGQLDVVSGGLVVNRLGNIPNATDASAIVEGSQNVGMYWQKGVNNLYCGVSFKTLCNNTLAERLRIDAATGNIGIGTTSPVTQLDVSGTLRVYNGFGATSNTRIVLGAAPSGGNLDYASVIQSTPNTGVNYGSTLSFWTHDAASSADPLQRMTILSNGTVGIGTTAPASILDISSTATNPGVYIRNCGLTLSNQAGYGALKILGHGTQNAAYIEDVGGTNYNGWILGTDSGNFGTTSNFGIMRITGGSAVTPPVLTVTPTSRIGINTTQPAYALDICGSVRALEGYKQGGNTWLAYSDERVKQNIQLADTSTCYSIVKNLHLKRFTWDASFLPDLKDRNVVGWIAQDVEKVFKRAVTTAPEFGFEDIRVLDVDQLYKTMYGALEKVIADKEALEAKVEAQETLLQSVLARLSALEASLPSSG